MRICVCWDHWRGAAEGCAKNVLNGRAFAKELFSLKVVNKTLERLLLKVFCKEENVEIHPTCLLTLTDSSNRSNLDTTLNDQSTIELIQRHLDFQNCVRNGHIGKTNKFWLTFMDQFKLISMLIYAVKTHNRKLFNYCNGKMSVLFFAYDGRSLHPLPDMVWSVCYKSSVSTFRCNGIHW